MTEAESEGHNPQSGEIIWLKCIPPDGSNLFETAPASVFVSLVQVNLVNFHLVAGGFDHTIYLPAAENSYLRG